MSAAVAYMTLIPDTNVYLHYTFFPEIDWLQLSGVRSVSLLVPPVVVSQLDTQKHEGANRRIRERAQQVIRKLHSLSDQEDQPEIRPRVSLRLLDVDRCLNFEDDGLDSNHPDDQFLAYALKEVRLAGGSVAIVTADLNMRLKCKQHGIGIVDMPEKYRRHIAEDERDKEIQRLTRENLQLKTRLPVLKVQLVTDRGSSDRVTFSLAPVGPLPEDEVWIEVDGMRTRLQYRGKVLTQGPSRPLLKMALPSPQDVDRYKREVERFLANEYKSYVEEKGAYDERKARTIELTFLLANEGTEPADDIDILLHFPDGVEVCDEKAAPPDPVMPSPPAAPKSGVQKLTTGFRMPTLFRGHDILGRVPKLDLRRSNVGDPVIRRTDSYEVRYPVVQLKHGFQENLGPLFATFPSLAEPNSFGISYTVHAANLPYPAEGTLHVIINRPE